MGHGDYSHSARTIRASTLGYDTKSSEEIFKSRNINNAMNPNGIKIRESRDSEDHPNSLAIVIALDVTGSMGTVPHHLVKEGLPNIMKKITESDIPDPQVLFLGIGDHECDRAPLQVGQFESNDELLDKWLTDIYLEGGGGGNTGESYLLSWYFAGNHTAIDCKEKRNKKGFLFTIGDEPTLHNIPKNQLHNIMGTGQYDDSTFSQLLDKARESYNVFHIHIHETLAGGRDETINEWKDIMGDNLLIAEKHTDVPSIIANCIIAQNEKETESMVNL